MATLATGPVLSRGALFGEGLGNALQTSIAKGATDRQSEIQLIKQYDPVREVLRERLSATPATTPGQQLLVGLTEDPLAFAKAMENPNIINSLTGTADLANTPKVEESPEDQAIRLMQQASQAEAAGDTIRPPILRARAAQLVPPIEAGDSASLDVFIAQTPEGNQVVQRNPETGKWTNRNGEPIELTEEAMIFNVADLEAGQTPREIRNDPQGVPRFVDTQEEVFPGTQAPGDEDEGSGQDAIFAERAAVASQALDVIGEDFTTFWTRVAERGLQGAKSEERQLFEQAREDFVTAVLRPESGAQINPSEFEDAAAIYIPAPGDSEAVLQRKAASRAAVVAGLEILAGAALPALREAKGMATVEVGGQEYLEGSLIRNAKDQVGVVQPDGTVDILGED